MTTKYKHLRSIYYILWLDEAGIKYQVLNNNNHIRLTDSGYNTVADLWPTTNRLRLANELEHVRGSDNIIAKLRGIYELT